MLAFCSSALSYAPVAPTPRTVVRASNVRMGVAELEAVGVGEGVGPETGAAMWDPLGLSDMASPKTLAWYRHAELKHGRVAMAAFVGMFYMSPGPGGGHFPLFPGVVSTSTGQTFESLGYDAFAAWDALPLAGKAQMIGTVGLLEFLSETNKPHYMMGGTPGEIRVWYAPGYKRAKIFDPYNNIEKLKPEVRAEKRISELKNGRLAMIGIMSVFAAHSVPGSVPALP